MSEMYTDALQETPEDSTFPHRPWLSILFSPRSTIRAIIDSDPHRYVYVIVMIAGVFEFLSSASERDFGDSISLVVILAGSIVIAPLAIIGWFINGSILGWSGRLLGGKATSDEVRAALAWSNVPLIISLFFLIAIIPIYGIDLFRFDAPRLDSNPFPFMLYLLLGLVLALWHYVILWKCYAEVHNISLLIALVAYLLPFAIILALLLPIIFLLLYTA